MVQFSQCLDCRHFMGKNEAGVCCCAAFAEGIPDNIFWNDISHKQHVEGDNGIKFEAIK